MEPSVWSKAITQLSDVCESVIVEDVQRILNEDRVVAGFPEITDIAAIENSLADRRRHYVEAIKSSLDKLQPLRIASIMTDAVTEATRHGTKSAPILIDELVDSYELDVHSFLQKEGENVLELVELCRASVEKGEDAISARLNRISGLVRNWHIVAKPLQISLKSRGLRHSLSHDLAGAIRGLAVDLVNDHAMLEAGKKLTSLLHQQFVDIPDIVAKVEEDTKALDDLAEQRKKAIEEAKEWSDQLSYQADVGALVKTRLKISAQAAEWGGIRIPLDKITRVRWGGTSHSINGIPTGTSYSISFGDRAQVADVQTRKQDVFANFVDRLWKGVGVRLLVELMKTLENGERVQFGASVVTDEGIELERRKFFGANERLFCEWKTIVIGTAEGSFFLQHKDDRKIMVALPYLGVDNVHVLEAAIRAFWKQGGKRISSILRG